jgi:hypothetical protein
MARPGAADDFPAFRARLEDLRWERGDGRPATIAWGMGGDPMRSAPVKCPAGRPGCRQSCAGRCSGCEPSSGDLPPPLRLSGIGGYATPVRLRGARYWADRLFKNRAASCCPIMVTLHPLQMALAARIPLRFISRKILKANSKTCLTSCVVTDADMPASSRPAK